MSGYGAYLFTKEFKNNSISDNARGGLKASAGIIFLKKIHEDRPVSASAVAYSRRCLP